MCTSVSDPHVTIAYSFFFFLPKFFLFEDIDQVQWLSCAKQLKQSEEITKHTTLEFASHEVTRDVLQK